MQIVAADREAIRRAIATAEASTSGEIFCVITAASDDYGTVPLLWAALCALSLPLPLIVFTDLAVSVIYAGQLALFLLLSLLLRWQRLRIMLVPRTLSHARAHRNAVEQFLAHGLHTTRRRTGVLLFVSLAERYAEVVADEGISAKVRQEVWDDVVDALVAGAKTDSLGEGFVNAIGIAGKVLAAHFPQETANKNELSDHLVIL